MKRLLVAFTLLFVSLNFIACSQKKENKTRLTQGAGRTSGATGAPSGGNQQANNSWNDLNQGGPQQVYLNSQNPDQTAREFLGEGNYGFFEFNSVVMRLTFNNYGQVVPNKTRLGLRFWDRDSVEPMSYLVDSNNSQISGSKNGGQVRVTFKDVGDITVEGTITGGTFSGRVSYDGGKYLGQFSVNVYDSVYIGY